MGRIGAAAIFVCFIGPARVATAECAWVLWIKHEMSAIYKNKPPDFRTSWEMINATPTHQNCEQLKEKVWAVSTKQYDELSQKPHIERVDKVSPNFLVFRFKESEDLISGGLSETFYCLPDTMDPKRQ